jgi:hypothetical protein
MLEVIGPIVICDWQQSKEEMCFVHDRLMPVLSDFQNLSGRLVKVTIEADGIVLGATFTDTTL